MASDFKELNLDLTRLQECLEEYRAENDLDDFKYSEESKSCHRVNYTHDGCKVLVRFLFIKNGTTTINYKVGKHHDKGKELADYLKNELVYDSSKTVAVSVRDIGKDEFDLLIDFFKDLEREDSDVAKISVITSSEDSVKKIVKATSEYKDSLTLTHYENKKSLLIQGKPLYVYQQVSYRLAEIIDFHGFLKIVYKAQEEPSVEVDEDKIESELKSLLPSAYSYLGEGLLKMLRTSYTLKDIQIPLPDYSCYVFPALRALEGLMRKLLFENGYSLSQDNSNSFYGIFHRNSSNGKFEVNHEFRAQFANSYICDALELCYTYYVQQRHTLFHANDYTDSSRFVENVEQANQMIERITEIIEKAFKISQKASSS